MGLFENWKVSGITTDAAKASKPFYDLAVIIETEDFYIPKEAVLVGAQIFLKMHHSFDLYFNNKKKNEKTEAIKFLVAFASYAMGKDRMHWDWQQVRNQSQGIYGSMEESSQDFKLYNSPMINRFSIEVKEFISNN